MNLKEFLSYFDFDYDIVAPGGEWEMKLRQELVEDGDLSPDDINENLICLIDMQGAYLGGIDRERYRIEQDSVGQIIDRMDAYINDSVISEFVTALEERDIDTENMDLDGMILKCKELGVNGGEVCYELAEAICEPESIHIEEVEAKQKYEGLSDWREAVIGYIKDMGQIELGGKLLSDEQVSSLLASESVMNQLAACAENRYMLSIEGDEEDALEDMFFEDFGGISADFFREQGKEKVSLDEQIENCEQLQSIGEVNTFTFEPKDYEDAKAALIESGRDALDWKNDGYACRLELAESGEIYYDLHLTNTGATVMYGETVEIVEASENGVVIRNDNDENGIARVSREFFDKNFVPAYVQEVEKVYSNEGKKQGAR